MDAAFRGMVEKFGKSSGIKRKINNENGDASPTTTPHDDSQKHKKIKESGDSEDEKEKSRSKSEAINPQNQPLVDELMELCGFEFKRGSHCKLHILAVQSNWNVQKKNLKGSHCQRPARVCGNMKMRLHQENKLRSSKGLGSMFCSCIKYHALMGKLLGRLPRRFSSFLMTEKSNAWKITVAEIYNELFARGLLSARGYIFRVSGMSVCREPAPARRATTSRAAGRLVDYG